MKHRIQETLLNTPTLVPLQVIETIYSIQVKWTFMRQLQAMRICENSRIRVSLMYHVNISLVRQINVNVNRQNCHISISSVVRMARTNKVPNKQQTICLPKVPFSYSPLNSRWSHPLTQRLFTFIVNNIPSHVSIIIVFVIIALLQSNDEQFHRLIYIYIFSNIFIIYFTIVFYDFFFFSLPFLSRQATSSKHSCRFNHMIAISANRITWGCVFDQHLPFYLFIYLLSILFHPCHWIKFLPNSFTTRIVAPRYPQDPSYEVYRLVKWWQNMRTEPRSSMELQKIARLRILRY